MTSPTPDIIDRLVGVTPGSPLDTIRSARPEARANAQASYDALFEPAGPGAASGAERHAVAAFVAGLHREPATAAHYADGLARHASSLVAAIAAEIAAGAASGPYGRYPVGPLSREDVEGPHYRVENARRETLGPRLAAALEHAHLLVFHPRDASPATLRALADAGWTTAGIVTLSQIVAFLAFQIRVVAGLKALAAVPAGQPAGHKEFA